MTTSPSPCLQTITPLLRPTVRSWIDFWRFKNGCGAHCYLSKGESFPKAMFFQNKSLPSLVPATKDLPLESYTTFDILSEVKLEPSSSPGGISKTVRA